MIARNERGIITVDFIFAIVLILGLTSVLFVLSFTMSVASIVQYAVFTAARNYAAGNVDLETQEKQAQAKYAAMISSKTFKPLFTNGWWVVDKQVTLGDHLSRIPGIAAGEGSANEFWGASAQFTSKVLSFNVPFFGSTAPDDDSGGKFNTIITAFLGREPTEKECLDFVAQRWSAIQALSSGFANAQGTYQPMTDNGC